MNLKIFLSTGFLLSFPLAVSAQPPVQVPEPSVIALLAVGAVGAGIAAALKKRRNKK